MQQPIFRTRYSMPNADAVEKEQKVLEDFLEMLGDFVTMENSPHSMAFSILLHMHSGVCIHGLKIGKEILDLPDHEKALLTYAKKYCDKWAVIDHSYALPVQSKPERVVVVNAHGTHVITGDISLSSELLEVGIELERIAWRMWQVLRVLECKEIVKKLLEVLEALQPLPVAKTERDPMPDVAPWEENEQAPLLPMPEAGRGSSSDFRR